MNSRKQVDCSSKYKGTCWDKSKRRWLAYIGAGKDRIYLGRFTGEEDAARAYDKAAKLKYGEFASLNFK